MATLEVLMDRNHWLGPAAVQELGLISKVVETHAQLEQLLKLKRSPDQTGLEAV